MIFVVYKEKIAAYERKKRNTKNMEKDFTLFFLSKYVSKIYFEEHYSKSLAENFVEDNKYL